MADTSCLAVCLHEWWESEYELNSGREELLVSFHAICCTLYITHSPYLVPGLVTLSSIPLSRVNYTLETLERLQVKCLTTSLENLKSSCITI